MPANNSPNIVAQNKAFEGLIIRYEHIADTLQCNMRLSVFLPPAAQQRSVPVLLWLSGLTCTDENFMQKAGVQRIAAQLGIAIVAPDTSPRGLALPGEDESYDLGTGAGFYLNATQAPWQGHYNMFDYVTEELPRWISAHLPVTEAMSISGHSMGGHGAMICGFKKPSLYQSISAFAPICNPVNAPWGIKAFSAYLGEDPQSWAEYDATALVGKASAKRPLLIDQGTEDEFLTEQLQLSAFEAAAQTANYPAEIHHRKGYDHSYYFIATFIESHLRFHASFLK